MTGLLRSKVAKPAIVLAIAVAGLLSKPNTAHAGLCYTMCLAYCPTGDWHAICQSQSGQQLCGFGASCSWDYYGTCYGSYALRCYDTAA